MCLALPGQVLHRRDDGAILGTLDFGEAQMHERVHT